jgi:hypothetical protein
VVDMIHPDDRKRALRNIRKAMTGTKLDGNDRMVGKDGTELPLPSFTPAPSLRGEG